VAERSARIGRTEVGNGFTLFGDFERLDRELDAAGLAVVLGDGCVDLFALAETLGTLVVAIAGEVGATDEGRDFAVRDANFDAAFVDVDDFGGDNSVLAQATGFAASSCTRLGQIISSELLDAEADAFLFDVDIENLGLDDIATVVVVESDFTGLLPVEVGQVNHAVHIAFEADEQAEFGLVLDFAFDGGANRDRKSTRLNYIHVKISNS